MLLKAESTINVYLRCAACGEILLGETEFRNDVVYIKINPCQTCLDELQKTIQLQK